MKRIMIGIVLLFLLSNGWAYGIQPDHAAEEIYRSTLNVSTPHIIYEQEHARVELAESNMMLMHPQSPLIPACRKIYTFPIGTTITKVSITPETPLHIQRLQYPLMKAKDLHIPSENFEMVTASEPKSTGRLIPSRSYEYEINAGIVDGEHCTILTIIYYPVRVFHHTLFTISGYSTEITYQLPADSPASSDDTAFLVIAPEKFSESLQPFIDHKIDRGVSTRLVTMESIQDETYFPLQGRDEAEQLKYFLRDAHEQWGYRSVLLVGGRKPGFQQQWYVPVRYVHVYWAGEGRYISDLYFADLYNADMSFSSWDTDGNQRYCEWNNGSELADEVDMYPDVIVGRWPCRATFEVDIMVEKTISYETNTPDKHVILIGGDNFEPEGIEGEIVCDKVLDYLPDFSVEKVYCTEKPLNPSTIIQGIGDGGMFLHFHGHASPVSWSTHPPEIFDEWEEGLFLYDIMEFDNTNYPITIVGGCHTALFNISLFHKPYVYTWKPTPEDISWWMARKIDGGGVASLGYTCFPVASPGEDGDLDGDDIVEPDCTEAGYGFIQLEFFAGYGDQHYETLGECWQYAVQRYLDVFKLPYGQWHLHTLQGFVLIGDPSLKIEGY